MSNSTHTIRYATGATEARLTHVETDMAYVKAALGEFKNEVRASHVAIVDQLTSMRNELARTPKSVATKDLITGIAAACAALTFCAGFANWWLYASLAPINSQIAAVARVADPGEVAVLKHRLAQLETRARK